jgi:hypothetical protein
MPPMSAGKNWRNAEIPGDRFHKLALMRAAITTAMVIVCRRNLDADGLATGLQDKRPHKLGHGNDG